MSKHVPKWVGQMRHTRLASTIILAGFLKSIAQFPEISLSKMQFTKYQMIHAPISSHAMPPQPNKDLREGYLSGPSGHPHYS